MLSDGEVGIARDAVVVHCAASGLQYAPLVPIWGPEAITLQPIRTGFPCFGAALAGYVEATRDSDDEKNRLCPPSPYSDTPADWARMQVLGYRATVAFGAEPDIREWSNQVTLNPARIPAHLRDDAGVSRCRAQVRSVRRAGDGSAGRDGGHVLAVTHGSGAVGVRPAVLGELRSDGAVDVAVHVVVPDALDDTVPLESGAHPRLDPGQS